MHRCVSSALVQATGAVLWQEDCVSVSDRAAWHEGGSLLSPAFIFSSLPQLRQAPGTQDLGAKHLHSCSAGTSAETAAVPGRKVLTSIFVTQSGSALTGSICQAPFVS